MRKRTEARSVAVNYAAIKAAPLVGPYAALVLWQSRIATGKWKVIGLSMLSTSSNLAVHIQRHIPVLAALIATIFTSIAVGQTPSTSDTLTMEELEVRRLHQLLENHALGRDDTEPSGPSEEDIAQREMAQRDAERQANIPYSIEKVRLNGPEGSTAMAHITRRLRNPVIPESRRDSPPICIIKTRLFDTLVGSENRSLKPVGKNHYIATVQLQAGETSLSIKSQTWELQLPENAETREFIITFYRPPGSSQELHVFAIDDLLNTESLHIPDWLPAEIQDKLKPG